MVRRFIFTSLALALAAQPAFAQTPGLTAPAVIQASAGDAGSEDGRDTKTAAFALGTVGVGVALGLASSGSDAVAPAFDYSVPTSDTYGGTTGGTGEAGPQQVPVPEPGTFPLMLAGLVGFLGLVVFRRRAAEVV